MKKIYILITFMTFLFNNTFADDYFKRVQDFFNNPFIHDIYIPPGHVYSLEEIFNNKGEPIEHEQEIFENQYDASNPITLHTITYEEYKITYVKVPSKDYYFRKTIYCNILDGKMKYNFTKDSTVEDIVKNLGKYSGSRQFEDEKMVLYIADDLGVDQVYFIYDLNEKLIQIRILINP